MTIKWLIEQLKDYQDYYGEDANVKLVQDYASGAILISQLDGESLYFSWD